jgi:hypothetical protein
MPESENRFIGQTCEIKSMIAFNSEDALQEIGSLRPVQEV